MPKIISRQPAWLTRAPQVQQLFKVRSPQGSEEYQSSEGKLDAPGLRTLATRGSEVFIADDRKIRWADLASMKADWETGQNQGQGTIDDPAAISQYRVLEFKYIAESIIQLIISPNKKLLAIVTAHTVHICTIPDSKHLSEEDNSAIFPRVWMIGQRAHILSSARLVSVLWHPFGVGGNCLVTVTSDSLVRVWELDVSNRHSFQDPTQAFDLSKLNKATSVEHDVRPREMGYTDGISYDRIGFQVANACFGGTGSEEELGWSGMTLWVAMTEGDVYALCPLLPKKWQALPQIMPNLMASVLAERNDGLSAYEEDDFLAQYRWLSEQENELPMEAPRQSDFEPRSWIYSRPKNVVEVPKLQGPFSIVPGELDCELALADIHVIASRLDYPLNNAEDYSLPTGMPLSTVCLLTQLATVYVCAELNGVHGRWLPTEKMANAQHQEEDPELIVLGAVDTYKRSDQNSISLAGWPTLTSDIKSPYTFYVTHANGVWYISAESWARSLGSEMSTETTAGAGFRLGVKAEGNQIQRLQLIPLLDREDDQPSAPLVIDDSDLGYLVLTIHEAAPYAAILDNPNHATVERERELKQEPQEEPELTEFLSMPLRATYLPSKVFSHDLSSLKDRLKKAPGTRLNQVSLNEQIRLSPAILEMMTHDHRVLSEETHKLGQAIADLFTRCNMMQAEFKSQIQRVREIAERVDNISNNYDEDDDPNQDGNAKPSDLIGRVESAQKRQTSLANRFERLRHRTGLISRPLSDREKAWQREVDGLAKDLPDAAEVNDLETAAIEEGVEPTKDIRSRSSARFTKRVLEAKALSLDLCGQVKAVSGSIPEREADAEIRSASPADSASSFSASRGLRIPPEIRKQKQISIDRGLERQGDKIEALLERLDRLGVMS